MLTVKQQERIIQYNIDRNLTNYNNEIELGFLIEELDEYFKAKTDEDRVDALCDMVVFHIGKKFKFHLYKDTKFILLDICRWVSGDIKDLVDITSSYNLHHVLGMIHQLGYNPTLCMDEVLNHIESRQGEINPDTGKFEKYTDDYHKSLWYEPNYNNCKYKDKQ